MQVLEGGKDNPSFDGQKMFQKLDGKIIPDTRVKFDYDNMKYPIEYSEAEVARAKKVDSILKQLEELDARFILAYGFAPENESEAEQGFQGGVRFVTTGEEANALFGMMVEKLIRQGVIPGEIHRA